MKKYLILLSVVFAALLLQACGPHPDNEKYNRANPYVPNTTEVSKGVEIFECTRK